MKMSNNSGFHYPDTLTSNADSEVCVGTCRPYLLISLIEGCEDRMHKLKNPAHERGSEIARSLLGRPTVGKNPRG